MSQTLVFAKEMRFEATDGEQRLWFHLRAHRLGGHKFKRQQPLGRYIVDFVCFEALCIVEADGGQHADNVAYDQVRDAWLRAEGFTVLRFWNNEVLTQTEAVLERILAFCNANVSSSRHPPPLPQPLPHAGGGGQSSSTTSTGSALSHFTTGSAPSPLVGAQAVTGSAPSPLAGEGWGEGADGSAPSPLVGEGWGEGAATPENPR